MLVLARMTKIFIGVMLVHNTVLTLEQEFELHVLKKQIQTLMAEQSQEFLLETFRQLMLKDVWIARILKDCT